MRSNSHCSQIVIIGGGLSGLSSAFYLDKLAKEQGREIKITLIEAEDKLGGKIDTLKRDGFVIEKGPDSFLARKLPMLTLAQELGLESELTHTNPAAKKTYILHQGKLHPMPPGLVLGIPTEIAPFAVSSMLTVSGKLRALLDMVLPSRAGTEDESIGEFLERRVGTEVMERIAEPLLAGIYAGELRKLSLRATFPQFREAEVKHGSLIRGMRANKRAGAAAQNALPALAKKSVFMTFKGGLSTVISALDRALPEMDRMLGTKVSAIHKRDAAAADHGRDDSQPAYIVETEQGEKLAADAVIVTTPVFQTAGLLKPHMDVSELEGINYVSVANVVLAFRKQDIAQPFDGSGFVVPRTEGRQITACTWTSAKWLHTSPEDYVLLRCYVGRSGDEAGVELPDDQLAANVRHDLREILGITAQPEFVEITRLRRSMPQYPVGHVENMAKLRRRAAEQLPGVWMTGAAFDGVGLPDCVRQGKELASQVAAALT
ncbi:protoporphyrinogen oxidase [Paenibacillaceae bacterium]|nr:protoporphyrinogen oxidase [Paenibacillaceae bacterium]